MLRTIPKRTARGAASVPLAPTGADSEPAKRLALLPLLLPIPLLAGYSQQLELSLAAGCETETAAGPHPGGILHTVGWAAMLKAAKRQLQQALGPPHTGGAKTGLRRASLLAARQCVNSIDQLYASLLQEGKHADSLQHEVCDTRSELALTRHELKGIQAQADDARHLALHDSLTGLPNRRGFNAALSQALRGGDAQAEGLPTTPQLALLYIDIDHFKAINDSYGHAAGDEVLKIVAHRLARSVRAGDTVGRLGGDEFACVLRGPLARDDAKRLALKLFDAIAAPLKIGALQLTVLPSIGIALCPSDGVSADELLTQADGAMFNAKRQRHGDGRNAY